MNIYKVMFWLLQFCLIYRVTNENFIYCAVIFRVECLGTRDPYYDSYHYVQASMNVISINTLS